MKHLKRLPEPKILAIKNLENADYLPVKTIRESLPPQWLLSELLFNTIVLCQEAHGTVTARMLLDSVATMYGYEGREETFFNIAYLAAWTKNRSQYLEFEKTLSPEQEAAWDKLDVSARAEEYLKWRREGLPQYETWNQAGKFLVEDYHLHLPRDLRSVIDCAFAGFIFNAVNGTEFGALCKDKALDVSGMTIEQRLDVELDHEALYNRLLVQLGHDPDA